VEPLDAQRRHHARVELRGIERLAQVVVRAAPERLHEELRIARVGEHDHRHRREPVVGAQPVEHRHAVRARQLVVEQHDVGQLALDQRERLLAVAGSGHAVAAVAELAQQLGSDRVRVLRDEHEGLRLFAHPHW
jgi:hypothetical protein